MIKKCFGWDVKKCDVKLSNYELHKLKKYGFYEWRDSALCENCYFAMAFNECVNQQERNELLELRDLK